MDTIYMCNIYGRRNADVHECTSRWSSGPRSVIKIFFSLFFYFLHRTALFLHATIYCIFLSAQAVVNAIGWVLMTTAAAPGWSLRRSVAVLESISVQTLDALGFVFNRGYGQLRFGYNNEQPFLTLCPMPYACLCLRFHYASSYI